MHEEDGWPIKKIKERENEISRVNRIYKFKELFNLCLPTTKIDQISSSEIVKMIGDIINQVSPETIYMPFIMDVHTDHQIISNLVQSSIKWFRFPSIKKVLMYETMSETDFNFVGKSFFRPNHFINISDYIDKKIEIMKIYKSEIQEHPFPRSEKGMRSLAIVRGAQSGYEAAESFQLVFERK